MNENELSLHEVCIIINDLMYGKKRLGLIDAYSYVLAKYKTDYSYEEVKDYLFHHDLQHLEWNQKLKRFI